MTASSLPAALVRAYADMPAKYRQTLARLRVAPKPATPEALAADEGIEAEEIRKRERAALRMLEYAAAEALEIGEGDDEAEGAEEDTRAADAVSAWLDKQKEVARERAADSARINTGTRVRPNDLTGKPGR